MKYKRAVSKLVVRAKSKGSNSTILPPAKKKDKGKANLGKVKPKVI